MNVWRDIKIVHSLPLLSCELPVSVKRNLDRKKIAENLGFVENSNFVRGSAEAGFCVDLNSLKNTRGGALF